MLLSRTEFMPIYNALSLGHIYCELLVAFSRLLRHVLL